jgi:hypothetical protein
MPPSVDKIMSNINFGTATGLTKTAKEGQAASVGAIKGTFITRGSWFAQQNRFGIKVKPATKTNLQAEVRTNADWLEKHETGEDKHARAGRVAVPTDQVRRNKRLIIPRGQRPKGLAAKVFVLKSKRGDVLAQRLKSGKRKGLIVLYGLERSVKIRKQSTFYTPIEKVVSRRLVKNVREGIDHALRTMR